MFTVTNDKFVGVGTTKTSIVKHWTGFGVLEKKDDKFYERVVSPSQFKQIIENKHTTENIDLVNLKNLKEVWIFNERFDFVNK